jgi:hypothetical protein
MSTPAPIFQTSTQKYNFSNYLPFFDKKLNPQSKGLKALDRFF